MLRNSPHVTLSMMRFKTYQNAYGLLAAWGVTFFLLLCPHLCSKAHASVSPHACCAAMQMGTQNKLVSADIHPCCQPQDPTLVSSQTLAIPATFTHLDVVASVVPMLSQFFVQNGLHSTAAPPLAPHLPIYLTKVSFTC